MSASFSRSIRTLQQESARRTSLFLLIIIGFIILWLSWFLFFPIAELETVDTVIIQNQSLIQATFPPEALLYLQTGQTAELRLDAFPWAEYGTVAVTVVRVNDTLRDGRVAVELGTIIGQDVDIPLRRDMTGSVTVEIGQITPVSMLWQIVGQQSNRLDNSSTSPNETTQ